MGKRHGQGVLTYSSGKQEVRIYRSGVRLSDEEVEKERQERRHGSSTNVGLPGAAQGAADLQDVVVFKKQKRKVRVSKTGEFVIST